MRAFWFVPRNTRVVLLLQSLELMLMLTFHKFHHNENVQITLYTTVIPPLLPPLPFPLPFPPSRPFKEEIQILGCG